MSRGGLPSDPRRQRSARGQSAGLAGRICRRATATVVVAWPAGFWMPASRRPCCCRGRRAYAGSASRCGAMNTANGWRRIVPALEKARSKSGRCRWIPGCRPAKGGARAWDRHRSHARRYRLRIPRRWCCPASVMGPVIKRLPGEARVMLPLQTSGGEGRRWWFINGEPLEAAGARTTLTLDKPGEWQLVVMDEAGQTAAASFTLQ
ncbi:Penicillin-insensitive transglycosylase [Klebsiella pneumoniae]|nr:Penicillin-insensitive transglycosylase [Klebsiella pneumoniae]